MCQFQGKGGKQNAHTPSPICVAAGKRTLFSTNSGWVEKERERNSSDCATGYLFSSKTGQSPEVKGGREPC